MKCVVLWMALNFLIPLGCWAQYYPYQHLNTTDGLSDNRVTCFLKDQAGYMWIGTANGLNRYDGHTFSIYRPGQSSKTISHEYINDIEEDKDGKLWIATSSGLNLLDVERDTLVIFSPDIDAYKQKKTEISSSLIWDTYIDKENRVWIAPDSRDLCYYDPSKKEFTYFPWHAFVERTLPNASEKYKAIWKIIRKSDDEVWLGTSLGLFSFDLRTTTFHYYGGEFSSDVITLVNDNASGIVYFGQHDLYAVRPGKPALELVPYKTDKGFFNQQGNQLMLPSFKNLTRVHVSSNTASVVRSFDQSTGELLHQPKVNAVYYDRDSMIWIGTEEGVTRYDRHMDIFPFTSVLSETVQTMSESVYHILESSVDGKLYISSYSNDQLIIIDPVTGTRSTLRSDGKRSLEKCAQVFEDSHKKLWVLTADHIYTLDRKTNTLTLFPYSGQSRDAWFVEMEEDADGDYWFASLHDGLSRYNTKSKSWTRFPETSGFYGSRVTSLLSDPAHRSVWMGDYGFGAFRYDLDKKTFNYFGMDIRDPFLPKSSLVNDIALDHEGNVWVATNSGGVSKFSYSAPENKKFTTYSIEDGLPEGTVHSIRSDRRGNLWLASFKGLTCINTKGNVIRHYDNSTGLAFSNFKTPLTINNNGEIYSGINNGFIRFHPDSLHVSSAVFPIVITDMHIGDSAVVTSVAHQLPWHKNELTFTFAALSYALPTQVTYYYKLDGYDDSWIHAGNAHLAKYTNLGRGTYTFNVRAIDHTGKPSLNTAQVTFVIAPPFWKTWWFIALVVLLFGASLLAWMRSLQQKVRSQKILNQVATSLYNHQTLEDVFWTVAKQCTTLLGFRDCVIYAFDEDSGMLLQKAAAGPKSVKPFQITNPLLIPLGEGIVGTVAKTATAEIIPDTSKDRRYIIDDEKRYSEICVPIIADGKVVGVIDSEDARKNFYTSWHLHMLKEIASICSAKVSRYFMEEQIRSKVARDLHDDVGSTLSSINIMSKIALEKNDTNYTMHYLEKIRDNASLMQESMSDMVWAINPENDTIDKVIIRMKAFAAEILEPLNIQYEFTSEDNLAYTKLDLGTRKDFFLIFKEAVNNAAKYSQCKKVLINLRSDSKGIHLTITDDGVGFDVSQHNGGNGLRNMAQRAAGIKAHFSIKSQQGNGTTVSATITSHD